MIQEKISREEFQAECNYERTFVTHEFTGCRTFISVGIWRGQRVALKQGRNLEKEVEIMKKIGDHPHIVKFIGEIEGDILMEGIKDGLTIQKFCYFPDPLPITTCVELMRQLASALKHLHDKGIIHHDLKNENVLVDLSGENPIIKLCDFGISEEVDQNGHGSEENRESGTSHSMAPEQNPKATESITSKIDVFAFGGICSGILLRGRNLDQVLYTCPIKLNSIVEKCHKKDPKDRPTMDSILKILEDPELPNSFDYKTGITQIYEECQKQQVPIPDDIVKLYQKVTAC